MDSKDEDSEELKQKKGVINRGQEYEKVMPGLIALKLLFSSKVKDFTLTLNPSSYEKFDDLIIDIQYHDNRKEKFAIQLKHREKSRDVLDAEKELYGKRSNHNKKNKPFDIWEYAEKGENILTKYGDVKLVLFTNVKFINPEKLSNYKINSSNSPFPVRLSDKEKINQFEEKDKAKETFFKSFFLFSEEPNFGETDTAIEEIFKNKFNSDREKAICYKTFFQRLHSGDYKDNKINREQVILILTKLLLKTHIITSFKSDHDIDLIEEAIKSFDLTILADAEKTFVEKNWRHQGLLELDNSVATAKEMKFLLKAKEEIPEENLPEVICSLKNKLLFLEITPESKKTITSIAPFLKTLQITLVFVGENIEIDGFNIWRNLQDLKRANYNLYQKITKDFKISLQGREPETLESLNQKFELDQHITPKEIFQLLSGHLLVGKKIATLHKFRIPRTLFRPSIQITRLKNLCEQRITVVYCGGKSKHIKRSLAKLDVNIIPMLVYQENPYKYQKPLVILTDKSEEVEEEFNRLVLNPDDTFEWKTPQIDVGTALVSQGDVNLLVGESGIGKTTIMTYLSLSCPSDYWVALIPLQQMCFKCDHKLEDLFKFLIKQNKYNIDCRFLEYFIETKRVLFLFDGLNELNNQGIEDALAVIKMVHRKDYKVWISCSNNLKERLNEMFESAHCYVVEELSEENQKEFITKQLKEEGLNEEEIIQIIEKWFEKHLDKDILKVPLILSILTDFIHDNQTEIGEALNLSEMYSNFINGRVLQYHKKRNIVNLEELGDLVSTFKNYNLRAYQCVALKTCLEPDLYDSTNCINSDKSIMETLKEDKLKLLKMNDKMYSFKHHTFAQFLSAMWLLDNFENVPQDKKHFIFQNEYEGIRKFLDYELARGHPLHLAVLDQDLERVKKEATKYLELDRGGRTAFHLAVSLGRKHPIYNINDVIYHQKSQKRFRKQEDILKYLLTLYDELPEKDELLGWNLFQYADASLCLFSLEELFKKKKVSWSMLQTLNTHWFSLSYHCATNGYTILLENVLAEKSLESLDEMHKQPLLHLAVKSNQVETFKFLRKCNSNPVNSQNNTPLHVAATHGNFEIAKLLLDADLEARDKIGRTPLQLAAKFGHKKIVELLIDKEVNIHTRDREQKTPLHKAAFAGRQEVVELLIEKNSEVDAVTANGRTALQRAAEAGHLNIVKFLIGKGANKDTTDNFEMTVLHYGVISESKELVEYLISIGSNVFAKNQLDKTPRNLAEDRGYDNIVDILKRAETTDSRSQSYLLPKNEVFEAAENGNLDLLKESLNEKNLEDTNQMGETVLHVASAAGHPEIVEYLLKNNANSAATNNRGRVPLHFACKYGHVEVVELLLGRGQDHAPDILGWTPLHWAAYMGETKVVKLLIDAKVVLDSVNRSQRTPLLLAAYYGQIEVIRLLVSEGADITKKNNKGQTCLHIAVEKKMIDTVKYLVSKHKKIVNEVDADGKTALHMAAGRNNKEIVDILLEGGADVRIVNSFGQTAFDIARETGQPFTEILKIVK